MLVAGRQHKERRAGQQGDRTSRGQEPNRKWTAAAPTAEFRQLLRPSEQHPAGWACISIVCMSAYLPVPSPLFASCGARFIAKGGTQPLPSLATARGVINRRRKSYRMVNCNMGHLHAGNGRAPILLEPHAADLQDGQRPAVNSNKRAADLLRDQLHSGGNQHITQCSCRMLNPQAPPHEASIFFSEGLSAHLPLVCNTKALMLESCLHPPECPSLKANWNMQTSGRRPVSVHQRVFQ